MENGIELIAKERDEQIKKHGWTLQHDVDSHEKGKIVEVVVTALTSTASKDFPLGWEGFAEKIIKKSYKEKLIIAGALIAAEIDRVQKLEN